MILTGVELLLQRQGTSLLGSSILILTLFNINLILLVILIILLSRNIIKFVFDRHQNVLGNRFRTKLIIAFVGFSIIPSILLFIVASGLLTSSINNWFSFKVEKSLKDSFEVARSFYEKERKDNVHSAEVLGKYIEENNLLALSPMTLKEELEKKRQDLNLSGISIYNIEGELISEVIDRGLVKKNLMEITSELKYKGLRGEKIAVVRPSRAGDYVIGISPFYNNVSGENIKGVVIATTHIRNSLVSKMDEITRLFEEYNQMASLKGPIKSSYILSFFIITLLIIFSAIWFGYFLAKTITIPIQKLAEATRAVANGNLDVRVKTRMKDEIGLLVDSFNKMTEDLKHSKLSLEEANRSLRDSNIELEQRRAYIETVMENIATGVISTNKNGDITTFNRSAERILGIRKEEVIDREIQEILNRLPSNTSEILIKKIKEGKGNIEDEEIHFNMDNRSLILRIKMTTLYDVDGMFLGNVIVFDDMSALIKAQRIAAWQEVAKSLAHEIKNPLTPIQLCTERLRKKYYERDTNYDKIFDECTSTIINEVHALKTLVNEFSNFARMPAPRCTLNNINSIIRDAVILYRDTHRDIDFVEDLDPSMPQISIDREQFNRVFINLFKNAIEAIDGTGHIWIRTLYNQQNNIVHIEVADDGTGILPEDRDRLFVPYFSRKKTGTGLGLAIVNRIISDHKGKIFVGDNYPKGTKFTIELPV